MFTGGSFLSVLSAAHSDNRPNAQQTRLELYSLNKTSFRTLLECSLDSRY